jgi:UPF0716 protein FxsA
MARWIVLLLALPVLDLYLLLRLRTVIGGSYVLAAVLLSALVGVVIARAAGARELRAWRESFANGRVADRNVLDSLLLWLGCGGLIVPGLVTDVLGLLLLVRPVRRAVSEHITRAVRGAIERGSLHVAVQHSAGASAAGWAAGDLTESVIDVEGEVVQSSEGQAPARLTPTFER